jgi:predicted metal-dependent phosphoesterase TrpH
MVTARSAVLGVVVCAGFAAGTIGVQPPPQEPLVVAGYQVLAVDFHVHPYPMSSSALPPWALVMQARRAGLDAVAVTPHNQVWPSRIARWFSTVLDGPIVLVGEEIEGDGFDLLAVGIERAIRGRQPARTVIADVHAQGGIAIAAHPAGKYVRGYDAASLASLDGTEIVHPMADGRADVARELMAFGQRTPAAPVRDSDFHMARFGSARTYVFSQERSAAGVLDAVRQKRTVVYDGAKAYGSPALIEAARTDGRLPRLAESAAPTRVWQSVLGILSLLAMVCIGFRIRPAA